MSNKTYDALKFIAQIGLPALGISSIEYKEKRGNK